MGGVWHLSDRHPEVPDGDVEKLVRAGGSYQAAEALAPQMRLEKNCGIVTSPPFRATDAAFVKFTYMCRPNGKVKVVAFLLLRSWVGGGAQTPVPAREHLWASLVAEGRCAIVQLNGETAPNNQTMAWFVVFNTKRLRDQACRKESKFCKV